MNSDLKRLNSKNTKMAKKSYSQKDKLLKTDLISKYIDSSICIENYDTSLNGSTIYLNRRNQNSSFSAMDTSIKFLNKTTTALSND